jgi:sulfur carrier protein
MKLHINGKEGTFSGPSGDGSLTVAALIDILGMKPDRVAVELNLDIVPRDRWAQTQLNEGDRLEVVHFVGGGLEAPFATNALSQPDSPRQELS